MNIPPKYEDVVANLDAALGREAALIANANQQKLEMDAACGEIELLQQRLTVAEQRAGELESAAREMLRIAGIANKGSNAYNRAIINLNSALKPAEGEGS